MTKAIEKLIDQLEIEIGVLQQIIDISDMSYNAKYTKMVICYGMLGALDILGYGEASNRQQRDRWDEIFARMREETK